MFLIIVSILILIGVIFTSIYLARNNDKKLGIICTIILVPLLCIGIFMLLSHEKYGSYSEFVTKYHMDHHMDSYFSVYTKDNFEFKYNIEGNGQTGYEINDGGKMNLNYQAMALNKIYNFEEGIVPVIYEYLTKIANDEGINSKIIMTGNHKKLEITYDNIKKLLIIK